MEAVPIPSTVDLTIVIPVYNALPYFHKCIESITDQDLGKYTLEVILVDDGSTDGSGEYCEEVSKQHEYIRTFHIENSDTPARPRNIGLQEARGNYIFFCDADDYFEENAIVPMLDHAYEDNCDVGLFKMVGENRTVPKVFNDDKIWRNCTVDNYRETNPNFLKTYAILKLYKQSLIEAHEVKFPEKIGYEDLAFTIECYFNANNICIYNDRIYYRVTTREDGSSLTQEGSTAHFWKELDTLLAGLEAYVAVASRYCTPDNYPEVYRRTLTEPIRRIVPKLKNAEEHDREDALTRMRLCLKSSSGSEPLR